MKNLPYQYQKRVVEEKRDLDKKLKKLNTFLAKPPESVEPAELELLKRQQASMLAYSNALGYRIERFK